MTAHKFWNFYYKYVNFIYISIIKLSKTVNIILNTNLEISLKRKLMAYSKCEYDKNTMHCLLYFNMNTAQELLI